MNEQQTKPIVYYFGTARFIKWFGTQDEVARMQAVLNHHVLGFAFDIRTSKVLSKGANECFETLNTRYEPVLNMKQKVAVDVWPSTAIVMNEFLTKD